MVSNGMPIGDMGGGRGGGEAHGQWRIPLDPELLARSDLSEFQRSVIAVLLEVVTVLPADRLRAAVIIPWRGATMHPELHVVLTPTRHGCAEVDVYVEADRYVRIAAGAHGSYSLPDDVWDPRVANVATFAGQIVRAIVEGKLHETTYFRGNVPVRWVSELEVGETPIRITRAAPLRWILHLWKPNAKAVRSYDAY